MYHLFAFRFVVKKPKKDGLFTRKSGAEPLSPDNGNDEQHRLFCTKAQKVCGLLSI